jgi:hypothetical protein
MAVVDAVVSMDGIWMYIRCVSVTIPYNVAIRAATIIEELSSLDQHLDALNRCVPTHGCKAERVLVRPFYDNQSFDIAALE